MNIEEAIKWLKEMRKDIPLPKSAKSQRAKNEAIDMAVYALSNCSEFPNNWIPCSERLPEEDTDVLVTRTFLGCKNGSHGWNNQIPPKTYVEVAQYFNGEWTALSDEYKLERSRHTNPIAWMPLPTPYQPEGENE